MQSASEHEASLAEYREQLEQVNVLLSDYPGNDEYKEMVEQLNEVIELTEDLLKDALEAEQAVAPPPPPPAAAAPALPPSAPLSPSAAAGGAEEAEEIYVGVPAPKRIKREEAPVPLEIPKSLEIRPEDDEKTKEKKRKKIKALKSRMRFATLEKVQDTKKSSWQNFLGGKGSKKKKGFFTGKQKESMFKTPDAVDGKVGVVGSGQGTTRNPTKSERKQGRA